MPIMIIGSRLQVAGNRVKGMSTMASKSLEAGRQQFQIGAKTLNLDIIEQSKIVAGTNVLCTGRSYGEIGHNHNSFRNTPLSESDKSENQINR
jgi:hypothetical protein